MRRAPAHYARSVNLANLGQTIPKDPQIMKMDMSTKLPKKRPHKLILGASCTEYKKTALLIVIAIIYGATILKVGYFLTTSLFLFASYYFLGERRWILMFLLSFPFVAGFMYLLHGVLEIYLRDPFLKSIGVMG